MHGHRPPPSLMYLTLPTRLCLQSTRTGPRCLCVCRVFIQWIFMWPQASSRRKALSLRAARRHPTSSRWRASWPVAPLLPWSSASMVNCFFHMMHFSSLYGLLQLISLVVISLVGCLKRINFFLCSVMLQYPF